MIKKTIVVLFGILLIAIGITMMIINTSNYNSECEIDMDDNICGDFGKYHLLTIASLFPIAFGISLIFMGFSEKDNKLGESEQ